MMLAWSTKAASASFQNQSDDLKSMAASSKFALVDEDEGDPEGQVLYQI